MTPTALTDAERAYFEERAAIRQYDGHQSREKAEAGALEDLERWRGRQTKEQVGANQ
jgi:hypothetical protein